MSEAWTISREVIIVAIGWIATIWWQSVRFARVFEGVERDIRALRDDVKGAHDELAELDKRDRVQSAANVAAAHLQMQQHAEFREHVAREYATKRDVEGIESRVMARLDRIEERLHAVVDKLDDLRDRQMPGRGGNLAP